jgi:hypothetical protein
MAVHLRLAEVQWVPEACELHVGGGTVVASICFYLNKPQLKLWMMVVGVVTSPTLRSLHGVLHVQHVACPASSTPAQTFGPVSLVLHEGVDVTKFKCCS